MSEERKKSKMPAQERARRRAAIGKAASEKVSKSEQVNFRLDEQSIKELQQMAYELGLPVGTMIRGWVLERLSKEKSGTPDLSGRAILLLDDIYNTLRAVYEANDSASKSSARTSKKAQK